MHRKQLGILDTLKRVPPRKFTYWSATMYGKQLGLLGIFNLGEPDHCAGSETNQNNDDYNVF